MTTIDASNEDLQEVNIPEDIDLSTTTEAVQQAEDKRILGNKEANEHIKNGEIGLIINYFDKYEGLNSDVAIKLINNGKIAQVASHLDRFEDLNKKVLDLLLKGYSKNVLKNINHFNEGCHKYIVTYMIENGEMKEVIKNFEKTKGISAIEIIDTAINLGVDKKFFEGNIQNFNNEGQAYLSEKLSDEECRGKKGKNQAIQHIKSGEIRKVSNYLANYEGLDSEVATLLINAGKASIVGRNLSKFENLDKDLAFLLIKKGQARRVSEEIGLFDENIHNDIATLIINTVENGIMCVTKHLSKYRKLNNEVAMKIIKRKEEGKTFSGKDNGIEYYFQFGDIVNGEEEFIRYIKNFEGLKKEMALELFKLGERELVLHNIGHFDVNCHEYIVKYLVENGEIKQVIKNIKNIQGINQIKFINKATDLLEEEYLLQNIKNFNIEGKEYFADKLIKDGKLKSVIENLKDFSGIDNIELIDKVIPLCDLAYLAGNINNFDNDGREYLAGKLVEGKYLKDSDGQRKQYPGVSGKELLGKQYDIIAINELKNAMKSKGIENLDFTITSSYPPLVTGKTSNGIPLRISHLKGKIYDIQIGGLDIELENMKEKYEAIKIIEKGIERVNEIKGQYNDLKNLEFYRKGNGIYTKNDIDKKGDIMYSFTIEEERKYPNLSNKKAIKKIIEYLNKNFGIIEEDTEKNANFFDPLNPGNPISPLSPLNPNSPLSPLNPQNRPHYNK